MNYIERLKKYVNDDEIYKEYRFLNKGKMMDYSDFDKFCIQHCKDIDDTLEENKRLNKQLDYIRSGEYYNQLRFERDMLQQVVDTNGVPSEVYDFIDCTHRNTELLEENDKLKEKINKIKDICDIVDPNWRIVSTRAIYDIEQVLYDSSNEEMEIFADKQDIEERYGYELYADYLEETIHKAIHDIDVTIEMIKQIPTRDANLILRRLNGLKNIFRGVE